MKRKAILIESSNVKDHTDLPGARVDIDNWNIFLRSDYGGAWADSEITILRKPYSGDMKAAIESSADTYCFVAFSGHGADGIVVLNDVYTNCPITELKPKGDKGTLIIDACRGVEEARQVSFARLQKFANEGREQIIANSKYGETLSLFEAKSPAVKFATTANSQLNNWLEALKAASKGLVEMYACAKGEFANENPSSGGFYTSLLLQSADEWSKGYSAGKIHTTKDAHDYAAKKLPRQQHPEYKPSWLSFPFASKG